MERREYYGREQILFFVHPYGFLPILAFDLLGFSHDPNSDDMSYVHNCYTYYILCQSQQKLPKHWIHLTLAY